MPDAYENFNMAMRSMLTASDMDNETDPSYFPFNGNASVRLNGLDAARVFHSSRETRVTRRTINIVVHTYQCDYVIVNRLFGHILTRDCVTSLLFLLYTD